MVETSVIILNYKAGDVAIECARSVLKSKGYTDYEILLVDNGSRDGSLEKFFTAFKSHPKVRILETGANLGYTGGNNFAVRHSRATEYCVVLNNDTYVEPYFLKELIAALEQHPDAAMASAHLANVPSFKPQDIAAARKFFKGREAYGVTLNPLGYTIVYPARGRKAGRFSPITAVHGGGFIFRKDIIGQPFDPDYFIYAEETKLSWLTRLRGHEILWARNAHVYHLSNLVRKTSSATLRGHFTYLGERNKVMNWLTLYSSWTTLRLLPVFLLGILAINAYEPRKMLRRARSYYYLLTHPGQILRKRREVARLRSAPDAKLLAEMSCKLQEDIGAKGASGALVRAMNAFTCAWFRLVGLPSVEHRKE